MKFKVTVTEILHFVYDAVEVEAEDQDEADAIAEEMRVQGGLGRGLRVG